MKLNFYLLGIMFGYATDETPELMPLSLVLAHKLNMKMAELRRDNTLGWLVNVTDLVKNVKTMNS